MNTRRAAGVVLVLLSAGACGGAPEAGPAASPPAPPHGRLVRRLVVGGVTREFLAHVPASVDGSRRVPVVFMLHGTSGSGQKFYSISGWVEKAEAEGFVAVFPSALAYCIGDDEDFDRLIERDEFKVTTKWAAGKLGTPLTPLCTDEQIARLSPERQALIESRVVRDDVAFLDAVVAALQAELPVDPQRLYVTGFSNGASMSGRLMIERSRTFAAFALAAGQPAVPGPAQRPAPVVFSVGSRDEGWARMGGVRELPADETILEIPELREAFDAIALDVELDPSRPSYAPSLVRGTAVATFTYDRSLVGADNELLVAVIDEARHQYPNGENHPVVMADLLWSFFSRQRLP